MEANRFRSYSSLVCIVGLMVFSTFWGSDLYAQAQVRIRDIAQLSGNREYQLIGYGLVTGLDGTGDRSPMAIEMMRGLLQNMGMDVTPQQIQSNNLAAVIVTAMLPAYGRPGESIDITISSIGDAGSLQGGVLLPTMLKGGDGQTYAVAQGQLSIGGFPAGNGGGRNGGQQNHLTVAQMPNGGILERSVNTTFGQGGSFNILLQEKNLELTRKVKDVIDKNFGLGWARIANPGNVEVTIPRSMSDDPVSFAASIENLTVQVEDPNRVVINERTGTIIVGNSVRISRVVISHNGIRIQVDPPEGQQAAGGRRDGPPPGSMLAIEGETTVDNLVEALNAVGATPRDIIAIFQTIKAAGALHGELRMM